MGCNLSLPALPAPQLHVAAFWIIAPAIIIHDLFTPPVSFLTRPLALMTSSLE